MEPTDTQTGCETRIYQIGGRSFTAPPIVARQEKWLWPLMKPLFLKGETITVEDILVLMGESITRMAAIVLVPDGQTQTAKVRAGLTGVDQLDAWLDESVSVAELGPVVADFFASGQQWTMLQGLAGPLRRATTGLTTPSAPLPMATPSAPIGSGSTSDSTTRNAILNDAVNAVPLSAPSWASVG